MGQVIRYDMGSMGRTGGFPANTSVQGPPKNFDFGIVVVGDIILFESRPVNSRPRIEVPPPIILLAPFFLASRGGWRGLCPTLPRIFH